MFVLVRSRLSMYLFFNRKRKLLRKKLHVGSVRFVTTQTLTVSDFLLWTLVYLLCYPTIHIDVGILVFSNNHRRDNGDEKRRKRETDRERGQSREAAGAGRKMHDK